MTLLPQPLPPWYEALGSGEPEDDILVCFASSMIDGQLDTWAFALPTVQGYFSGVGDLFSAMVLAHYAPESVQSGAPPLAEAVSKALLTVQQILLRTHLFSLSRAGTSGSATPRPLHTTGVSTAWNSIPSDTELDSDPLNPRRKARRMRLRELRVVQEHHLILNGGGGWPGARLDWQGIT
jgi:pyridoxine kinase